MPSRRRHRRPNPQFLEQAAEVVPVPVVTEEDRKNFGSLALWAARYVNHVYENAGGEGKPLRKIWNEAVYWQRFEHDIENRLFIAAKGLTRLVCPSLGDEAVHAEYRRQVKFGTELEIEKRTFPYTDERSSVEDLRLEINADEVVIGGAYGWYGARNQDQPAPAADFNSIEDAHNKGVSARAAFLLGEFRDLALEDGVKHRLESALWIVDYSAAIVPKGLIPLPEFV